MLEEAQRCWGGRSDWIDLWGSYAGFSIRMGGIVSCEVVKGLAILSVLCVSYHSIDDDHEHHIILDGPQRVFVHSIDTLETPR